MNLKHGQYSRQALVSASATRATLRTYQDALILMKLIPNRRMVGRYPKGYAPLRSLEDLGAQLERLNSVS